ncbi:Gfo/Idh/MocA family protein [Actinacidiphila bryophytorum]|uniref:Predicted dehydrogenase n=1 Tax=Actinacidiphila bryophytorum TaxID=1436133 RepID=A0A9W4H6K1_9ACTN|nr:Gfo/Idh/MocA family oxidoreductase [Actinacidiphila bryophytorum]MBM9436784.1 Gfo/Idh/MocA family oxidoreductase [Actinacidiphila bryophytorum]MBN6542204.1 Gfo/Idh/MocA family oxidoreductase [Actinacidiphila bryophytorum]CAG7654321.1 Predicted dehydrogenase [Actinacidiphila bryophytorum]
MGEPLRVGMVGAGKISGQYLDTVARLEGLRLTAVTDLDPDRAKEAAEGSGADVAGSVAELVARDDVDAVLNLTIPAVHAEVALAAIAAGKHVYGEKPLGTTRAEAAAILAAARTAGVRVGSAPDTVLGTGTQTARKAVDDGLIGTPVAATAFMTTAGHEAWHPDPEFYYRPGGGPLLDMGPYYLSALVHLLGPVVKVTGAAATPRAEREIGSGPRAGQRFAVEVDTHVTGVLQHAGGALSTLIMSFDIHAAHLPRIEVHGTAGSLGVPDPNGFEGPVELFGGGSWQPLPVSAGYRGAGRGTGLADLAAAVAEDRPHLASAELAEHVLDVMLTLLDAAHEGRSLPVQSSCERPAAVPLSG